VRAQPQPSVSTPLAWSELTEDLDPSTFTIDTVLPRVRRVGDLWAKGMKTPNSLDGILGRG
jgi:bifunctional non-homologous end joining protein LigD